MERTRREGADLHPPGSQASPELARRSFLAAGAVVAAGLTLSACGGKSTTSGSSGTTTLRIVGQPDPNSAPQIIAEKKGFFKKYGIIPDVTNFADGGDGLNSLLSGQMDFLVSSALGPLGARAQNGKVWCIGREASSGSHLGILTKNEVTSAKDLVAKKVGFQFGSAAQIYFPEWLQRNGVDPSKVPVVNVDPPDTVAALSRGDLYAAVVWEPWRDKILKSLHGYKTLTVSGDIGYYVDIDIWVGRALHANPKAEAGLIAALYEASRWLSDPKNLNEGAALVAPVIGVEKSLAKEYIGKIWNYDVKWTSDIEADMKVQANFAKTTLKSAPLNAITDWDAFYAGILDPAPMSKAMRLVGS